MVESGIIKGENRDLYEYGIRRLCFTSLNLITEVIIGIMSGMLMECIAFLIAYIPLRRFAGGFHADSELRCYGVSTLMLCAGLTLIRIFQGVRQALILPTLFIMGCGIIFAVAPVDCIAKPLDKMEHRVFRKRTRWILGVHIILFVLAFIKSRNIAVILVVADEMLSVMLLLGIIKNRISAK